MPARGIVLRSALVLVLLDRGGPTTVRELVSELGRCGVVTLGRPSKAISDALRWEVGRGRVRRVSRSTYVIDRVSRQTAWRMRRRLADHQGAAGSTTSVRSEFVAERCDVGGRAHRHAVSDGERSAAREATATLVR